MTAARLPSAGFSITVRLALSADPGAAGRLATVVGQAGAIVTALDVVASDNKRMTVDLTCDTSDAAHAEQVTNILEAMPEFLAAADAEVAKLAAREFKKQGLDIRLGAKVSKAEVKTKGKKKEVAVTYTDDKGAEQTLVVDKLLVAVGRRAATKGLLAEGTGVQVNERGQVVVDEHCHTGVDGVWAVGDCVRGPMLAHKGFEEGIAVAELIAGLPGHVNFDTIPWVIYTGPEIAWVGKTEQQLKAEGVPYKTGTLPFAAVGRAVAMAEPVGFAKVIAHAETDRVLGLHLVGPNVSELVHEGVLTMEFSGSADDLARICHAHPSLSEAIHDAAMAVDKRAIHKAN